MSRSSRSKRRRDQAFAEFTRRSAPPADTDRPAAGVGQSGPDPAARGATVGRGRAIAIPANTRLERAIERFNGSAECRTVEGLIRTLGVPWVSVGSAAGSAGEIRITVAWELSWYQWGVDPSDETRPVYAISKGREIVELDSGAQHWNASAATTGRLSLGTGRIRRPRAKRSFFR